MTARTFFWIAMVVWAAAFVGSLMAFQLTDASGDGFTRGWNKVGAFFGWQFFAGLLAVVIWLSARRRDLGTAVRWTARIPVSIFGLLVSALLALYLFANFNRPSPIQPPNEVPVQTPTQP